MQKTESNSLIQTTTDKTELLALARKLGPIKTIYDCGSRDALDGIELACKLQAQELHLFECNPASFEVCKNNISRYLPAQIEGHLSEVALADREGEITFHPIDTSKTITSHPDGNPGASSLFPADPRYRKEKYVQNQIKVNATTLDAYSETRTLPDLLWMDVQGAELLVLKGGANVIKKVRLIHLEVGFRKMYQGQALFFEINNFLKKDFYLAHIDVGRWPRLPRLYSLLGWGPWLGNAIYVNKNLSLSPSIV